MPTKPRRRSERAVLNDAAIRDAAIAAIVRVGVDSVSLRDVGISAGLTHGATYARYEDVDELLVDLWQSRLSGRAIDIYEKSISAVASPSESTVGALVDLARQPHPENVAMVETLLVSRRIPVLHEEIEPFVRKYLEPDEDLTPNAMADFTRVLSVVAVTMVTIFEEYHFDGDHDYLDALERILVTALKSEPAEVAVSGAREVVTTRGLHPDDELRVQLAFSTYFAVGKSGYPKATISRIARRVGCSPGAIYKLYKSKEELVLDAFRRIVGAHWIKESDFTHLLDVDTIAQLLSREASDANAFARDFRLETVIAAAHNHSLQPAVAGQLKDPGGYAARITSLDDEKKSCLARMVHSVASVSKGVRWLATITPTTETLDFAHFAESFRRGLKSEWQRVDPGSPGAESKWLIEIPRLEAD